MSPFWNQLYKNLMRLYFKMADSDGENVFVGGFMDDIVYSNEDQWKPIGLTHVEYIKGDHIGHLLAWFSLLPIFLLVAFATLILFRRDLHTVCYALGIVLDEAVNWILKHTIKEHRPDIRRVGLTTEYGMPSSHSQFMSFFSTYLLLFLIIRVHSSDNLRDMAWKYVTALGGVIAAMLVCYSRVYLGYHTSAQVLCGSCVGCVLGVLWFCVVHLLLSPHFPAVASSWLGELLMLRDSTLIPNVLWFEYCNHRTEMKNRLRKLSSRKLS